MIIYGMKKLLVINSCLLVFLMCSALFCDKPPQYDVVPHIEYLETKRTRTIVDGFFVDYIIPVIHFEDGNGDLGLTAENVNTPPFNEGDNRSNYFIEYYIKKNNVFEPLNLPFTPTYRFFPLAPDGRVGPLEGDLKLSIAFDERTAGRLIKRGDILKLRIKVRDRALNMSNTVDSDEIPMFVP